MVTKSRLGKTSRLSGAVGTAARAVPLDRMVADVASSVAAVRPASTRRRLPVGGSDAGASAVVPWLMVLLGFGRRRPAPGGERSRCHRESVGKRRGSSRDQGVLVPPIGGRPDAAPPWTGTAEGPSPEWRRALGLVRWCRGDQPLVTVTGPATPPMAPVT